MDTSGLSLHQLRDLVKNIITPDNSEHMSILFESFGFKRGVPSDSDFVFDVRCLPNPYWKQQLKNQTGNDQGVIQFLESQVEVASMLADIIGFLTRWIPHFQQNNRSYLTVSIGCTGGQHRSVYLANRLYEHFAAQHPFVQVVHKGSPSNFPDTQIMIRCQLEIINKLGLHARAATKLAAIAGHYLCTIRTGTAEPLVMPRALCR